VLSGHCLLPGRRPIRLHGLLAGGRETGHPLVVAGLWFGLFRRRGFLGICAFTVVLASQLGLRVSRTTRTLPLSGTTPDAARVKTSGVRDVSFCAASLRLMMTVCLLVL